MSRADRPRAASPLGRILRRRPPVERPSRTELEALSAKDRQDLWDGYRHRPFQVITAVITSLGVLLSVAFTAFGLIYTAKTLQAAQEGQITDRYTKAVEQLASPAVDVRLGGIYALQRLAADSPRDRSTVRNVLAAFVRHHDFCAAEPPAPQCSAGIYDLMLARTVRQLPTDVAAAVTIALSLTTAGDDLLDLSQSRFPRVDFPRYTVIRRVDLSETDLVFVSLSGADLSGSKLRGSCLTYANLTDADLTGADLYYADLSKAQLSNANLTGADLRGADLRDVFGVTPEQVRAVAKTDEYTKFGTAPKGPDDQTICGPQSTIGLVLHPRTTSK